MRILNPAGLPRPVGFSHVTVAGPGQIVMLAGQTGHHEDGTIDDGLVDQFWIACHNVVTALAAAGAKPENVISLQIFTATIDSYRQSLGPIGEAYRSIFGSHYPAIALLGISELFDPAAKVQLVAMAFLEHEPTD